MAKIAAVIFDMDGVLIDSEPIYDEGVIEFLKKRGHTVDPSLFTETRGMTDRDYWRVVSQRLGTTTAIPEADTMISSLAGITLADLLD